MAMQLKLNRKKSYGQVFGVPGVHYQQDDQLFGILGEHVGPLYPDRKEEEAVNNPIDLEGIENAATEEEKVYIGALLKQILDGGKMLESAVKQEFDDRSMNWDSVLTVAADLNVSRFTRKNQKFWELKRD